MRIADGPMHGILGRSPRRELRTNVRQLAHGKRGAFGIADRNRRCITTDPRNRHDVEIGVDSRKRLTAVRRNLDPVGASTAATACTTTASDPQVRAHISAIPPHRAKTVAGSVDACGIRAREMRRAHPARGCNHGWIATGCWNPHEILRTTTATTQ
jgi:hypothetical protein